METKKLIETALDYVRCGIGANYSRESFSDRMDEIYVPFAELVNNLVAENARLRADIEANNDQEHVGIAKVYIAERAIGKVTVVAIDPVLSAGLTDGQKVFARPIPAQKSVNRQAIIDILVASGNLSEGVTADLIISAIGTQQSTAVAVPEIIRFDYVNADGNPDSKMITHEEMRRRYADLRLQNYTPSPRITEQDFREIIKSYMHVCIPFKVTFESWMSAEGRTLLTKLKGGKNDS